MRKIMVPILVVLHLSAFARIYYYQEMQDKPLTNKVEIFRHKENFQIMEKNSLGVSHTFLLDSSYSCLEWSYVNPQTGSDYCLTRISNRVHIEGLLDHQKISRDITLENLPFYQNWSWGMSAFTLSQADHIQFISINPLDPGMVGKLEAVKIGIESLSILGKPTETVKIRITIAGIPDFIYQAYFWMRKQDGVDVRFQTPDGLGKILTRELISEKQ